MSNEDAEALKLSVFYTGCIDVSANCSNIDVLSYNSIKWGICFFENV